MAFFFNTTPAIRCGTGLSDRFAETCGGLLGKSVLFVTDAGLMKLGLPNAAITSLEAAGIEVTVFDAVEADPSLATLMTAVRQATDAGATGVVGFGGGSSMDVAKLAALLAGSGEDIDEAWGVGNAKGPRLPLVLVPTTAGTGSEVTPVSIITVAGDEIETVSQSQSGVHFDLNGDYFAEQTGWLGADDGFLVIDRNANGVIDDITEMFGAPGVSGYGELAALDVVIGCVAVNDNLPNAWRAA